MAKGKTRLKASRPTIKLRPVGRKMGRRVISFLKLLCGQESDGKLSRSGFWNMTITISTIFLLVIAFFQLKEIKETTNAEFSHKIKNDLYTPGKLRLITLFDADVLQFKAAQDGVVWFELDTVLYNDLPSVDKNEKMVVKYNVFEVDELLQDFEDLSFYEKRGQITLEYIYDAYAYYIEMLWQNPEIKKYITWQRSQDHNGNSYIHLEHIFDRLKAKTDKEK